MSKSVILSFSIISAVIMSAGMVMAADSTKSATPTEKKSQQIEDLKERLATKVAQLAQMQRLAIYGTVKTVSLTSLTVETSIKDYKIELTDGIKVAQNLKGTRTKLTVDDIDKTDTVVIFGDYDTTLDVLKAKVIFIQDIIPVKISGTAAKVDTKDFSLTLSVTADQSYTVDFEKVTKAFSWTQEKGLEKSGFSKIAVGDSLVVTGIPVTGKTDRISSLRIVDLGKPFGNQAVSPTPTGEISPATTKAAPRTTPAGSAIISPTAKSSKSTPTPIP